MKKTGMLAVTMLVLFCGATWVSAAEKTKAPWPEKAKIEAVNQKIDATIAKGPFQANWDSLHTHKDPEWFRDAKFGIYTHWGPITVATEHAPAGMEWYAQQLYMPKHPAFKYHQQLFGDQKTVGYKDVIPRFTAEKFNAEEWAELFEKSGAKFAGPVAIHHDNYANWDSDLTRWNSMKIGPKRDLTGELAKAIRAHGMKFIATFHHGWAWRYYEPAFGYDAADGQNADLYTEPHAKTDPPSKRFLDTWLALVDEVLNKYQPDLIWFDFELSRVITPEYQQRMFADTYDWAAQNGREVGVTHKFRDIHEHTGILDFERGREDKLTPYPWLTDTAIGPWFHHDVLKFKTTNQLVDVLVDIVSKNGCMLLNAGPKADGSFPEKARELLLGIGGWLKVNGEAIYGTRPWTTYGEGPTKMASTGGFSENKDKDYTAQDIRFTTKGGALYAIALDWPGAELTIKSLGSGQKLPFGEIKSVRLLGSEKALKWTRDAEGLKVKFPKEKPCDFAYAIKISGE